MVKYLLLGGDMMKLSFLADKAIKITQGIVGELEPLGISLNDNVTRQIVWDIIKKTNTCLKESDIEIEIDVLMSDIDDKIYDTFN